MKKRLLLAFSFFIVISFFMVGPVSAATVTNVKGNQVLIDLEGASATPGSQMYTTDSNGKKVGLIEIKQVKNGKAIADIKKGSVSKGQSVVVGGAAAAKAASAAATTNEGGVRKTAWSVGGLFGYALDSMALTAKGTGGTPQENITLAGSSMAIEGFADYDLNPSFTIRGVFGITGFAGAATATNSAVCSNTTACSVNFNYLAFEGHALWNFYNKKGTRAYLDVGYAFLMTNSASNNVTNLDTSTKTNSVLLFGGGTDLAVGKNGFIPLVFEYGYYPSAGDVKATSMYFRGGYGYRF